MGAVRPNYVSSGFTGNFRCRPIVSRPSNFSCTSHISTQPTMTARALSSTFAKTLTKTRPKFRTWASPWTAALIPSCSRQICDQAAPIPVITSSQRRHRPSLRPNRQHVAQMPLNVPSGARTIFIQTEITPNADVCGHPGCFYCILLREISAL